MLRYLSAPLLLSLPLFAQIATQCPDTATKIFDASSRYSPVGMHTSVESALCRMQQDREEKRSANARPRGAISIARLAHKPPKAARKEYARAVAAHSRQDNAATGEHLLRTVELDPDFVDARNNLGAWLYRSGRFTEAATHLQAAADLDPNSPEICANLGITLAALDTLQGAEHWARRALRLQPDSPKGMYVLAFVLVKQNRNPDEALRLLEQAAPRFPAAQPLYALLLKATTASSKP